MAGSGGTGEALPAVTAGPSEAAVPSASIIDERSSIVSGRAVIALDHPSAPNQVVTADQIVVRGHLHDGAERVQVLLQSAMADPLVVQTVTALSLPHAGDGHGGRTFVVSLALPEPRPYGPAVVQLVAYDERGRARDMLLVPIQIGATTAGAGVAGRAGRPVLGEDGLMGGIVFDTAWPAIPGARP